uniref:Mitochondrial transcription factor A n=1 Tax=Acrobeloides nanus TaxID=290746 RepID=A0A914C675_9BILA
MSLISTLSQTCRLISSRNLLTQSQVVTCARLSSFDDPSSSQSSNPYTLFIQEKSRSGEKIEGGLKGYAKLWKELSETAKQKYKDKAAQFNQNQLNPEEETEPQKKRRWKKRSERRYDDEDDIEIDPVVEDKFMNLPYEPIPRAERLKKEMELEKERKSMFRKMKKDENIEAAGPKKEKLPRLGRGAGSISPYYVFMTRVSPKLPDSPQKAAQLLGLWRKLSPEKKEEYSELAEKISVARKEKFFKLAEEEKERIREDEARAREERGLDRKWLPNTASWRERMDELLEAAKKLSPEDLPEQEQENLFPELTKEEIELQKKLLQNNITVTRENIGTKSGPLGEDATEAFKVTYVSMKGEEKSNEAEASELLNTEKLRKSRGRKTKKASQDQDGDVIEN